MQVKDRYILRDIFDDVKVHLGKPEITIITGSRQVGKTVLLEQLRDFLIDSNKVSKENILFYNLDLVQDWEIFQNQANFIEFLKEYSPKNKIYIFVDEAQKVPEAARFFKGVYDSKLNIKLILTGSSSLEIKAKFKETLAGRKRMFSLYSFSFNEFLSVKDRRLLEYLKGEKRVGRINQSKILDLYKEFIVFGGYPRVVLASDKEEKTVLLREIYSSYVEKDAVGFLEIKNKAAFNRLIKLLSAQIGQLVNINELSLHLGVDRQTVERYIMALEETFILKKISPYFTNPRQEIIKSGKIYFLDLGIRNLSLENFDGLDKRADKGHILENAIFSELYSKNENRFGKIHFWRTKQKAEVDFVLEKGLDILPIEVKSITKENQIPSGLRSFVIKFRPKEALIINLNVSGKCLIVEGTAMRYLYPFEMTGHINKKLHR